LTDLDFVLGSKWARRILPQLAAGVWRFNQLKEANEGLSAKTLSGVLKRFVDDGLATRDQAAGGPLHVEYTATEKGKALSEIILKLEAFEKAWVVS